MLTRVLQVWCMLRYTVKNPPKVTGAIILSLQRHDSHVTLFSTDSYKSSSRHRSGISHLRNVDKYEPWTAWTRCSTKCTHMKFRRCRTGTPCEGSVQKLERTCWKSRGPCAIHKHSSRRRSIATPQLKRIEDILYDLLYYDWSAWSACTRSCKKRRYRTCALGKWCKNTVLMEEKRCYISGSSCQRRSATNKGEGDSGDAEEEQYSIGEVPFDGKF